MPSLALLPFTPSFKPTKSPYPVWTNSQRADIGVGARDTQPPKNPNAERKYLARLYRKARMWKAKHPNIMTQATLRVFESLCFDFANAHTGKLFPSHATIARKCGIKSVSTVKEAMNRLRDLGLLHWQRRCVQSAQALGGFILKQITNLYTILPTSLWEGFEDTEKVPQPEPHEYGPAYTIPHGTDAATAAMQEAAGQGRGTTDAALAGISALSETAMTETERCLASLFTAIAKTAH